MRTIKAVNIFFLIMVISAFSIIAENKADVRKEKKYDKQFKVNNSTVVMIKNKFGKVNIVPWNQNYVKIDIEIVVEAKNDDRADKLLDKISIEFIGGDNSSEVGAKTDMKGSMNTSKGEKFEINYEVKVPASQPMDVSHQFGPLVIGDLKGKLEINHQHGNAMLGKIVGNGSTIDMQFGDLDVEELSNAEVEIQHCGNVSIEKANKIQLESQHSNIRFGRVSSVEIELQHGKFHADNIESINGDVQFSKFTIGTLTKKLSLDVQHTGSFKIDKVTASVNEINLDVQFSSPTIQFENLNAWTMEIDVNHGKVSYPSGFSFNTVNEKSTSATYRRNGGSGRNMIIDGQFSNVTLR
ncbi:hypothetical protein OO013_17790 [Mangrovivirga sp. M17]|uniref:Adhesin domain-containing protein n=1 Tax=Mangrovivirga halotolerans TaxID=2993936 RepID=A0ABT3RVF4_9BACT|nr:hypothetical protein [Mangrovivirga halotolerans]MCX2745739.1 hypothetical protein [Mangrovivirga halotolerans]